MVVIEKRSNDMDEKELSTFIAWIEDRLTEAGIKVTYAESDNDAFFWNGFKDALWQVYKILQTGQVTNP